MHFNDGSDTENCEASKETCDQAVGSMSARAEDLWQPQDMAMNLELHREVLSRTESPEVALGPLFALYQAGGEHHASDRQSFALAAKTCRKLGRARERSEVQRAKLIGACEEVTVELGDVSLELAKVQQEKHSLSILLSADGDKASELERTAFAKERLADDLAAETDALQNEHDKLQSEVNALVASGLKAAETRSAIQMRDREADSNWAKAELEMEDREKTRHLQKYRLRAAQKSLQDRRETYVKASGLCQELLTAEAQLKKRLREEQRLSEQLRKHINAMHRMATIPRKQAALSVEQSAVALN